jgi:hypothetical protein
VVVLLALLALAGRSAAQVSATATVSHNPVEVGQSFELTITVQGDEGRGREPELPRSLFEWFDIRSSGTSTQFSIVNGQASTSIEYRYLLVAREEGTVTVGAIPIRVRGGTVETEPFTVEVVARGGTSRGRSRSRVADDPPDARILLVAEVDKREAYVGEEILLTVYFYHQDPPLRTPEYVPPSTNGFTAERLPDGPSQVDVLDGKRFYVEEIRYALFPLGAGTKTIGSARIQARIPRSQGRRDPFSSFFGYGGQTVTVESDPITVEVTPLPPTDDPSFRGAVGSFEMRANLDRTEARVNDPVTLDIEIVGVGNLGAVNDVAPELPGFRVFDASAETEPRLIRNRLGGVRRIQRVFVPLESGVRTIPAHRFTFFDPDAGRHRTLSAGPFEVRVAPGEDRGPGAPLVVGKGEVRLLTEELRFIHTDPPSFRPVGGGGPGLGGLVHLVPVVALAGGLVWRRRRDRLEGDPAYARARRAEKQARERLARAAGEGEAGYGSMWSAVAGYVTDRLDHPGRALTAREAADLLRKAGVDEALVVRVAAYGERCDFARFAPGTTAERVAELGSEAASLLGALAAVRLGQTRGGGR